ncbi:zinc finger protein 234-like isoform X2 [Periplaneta americana]
MNEIKMEAEVDPLSLESQDNKYKIKENMALLEVGKLPHLQVVDIKTECVDHSYDFTSEIKVEDFRMVKSEVEDTSESVIYPVVKYEVDENLFDMDRVQQEEKVEISSNEDDILLTRNTNNDKSESSECDWIARDEQNLMQNGCYIFDDSIACDVSHDSIKCNICNEDFVTPQLLKRHFQIHTLEKSFKCDVCGDSFFEVNDLEKHSVLHTGETPVQCDVRGKIFVQPVYVKSEEPLETDDEEFKCDVCGKCFSESGELKKHCLTHKVHKPFHCKLCGKWFFSSGTLKRHQSRIHIVERTVECDQCGQSFPQSSLKDHSCIHMPYKCDLCGKYFLQAYSLKRHLYMHTGKKPYKCDLCGKCFSFPHYFKVHTQRNSCVKPFRCDICGKTFSNSDCVRQHLRIHSVKMSVKCHFCGNIFSSMDNLKNHLRLHTDYSISN